jgi:hypothetical protein
MRMSKPFRRSSAILLLALLAANATLAQDSARTGIEKEGAAAMERIEGAISRQKEATVRDSSPAIPGNRHGAERRRAFDGLRNHVSDARMEARARAAAAAGSASLAAERAAQAKRLRQALGLEPSEEKALAKAAPAANANAWVPLLFVSSSMPVPVLRAYAVQLEPISGVLAFRGMPGGLNKVGPMAKLSAEILRIDPGCEGPGCAMRAVQIIIDPILFRQHGVTRVPALAMIPGDPTQAYCDRDDESLRASHLVFGDSALPGLLEEYARLGGRKEVRNAQGLMGPL